MSCLCVFVVVLLLASTPTFLGKVHEQLLKATAEAYVASFFKLGATLGRRPNKLFCREYHDIRYYMVSEGVRFQMWGSC